MNNLRLPIARLTICRETSAWKHRAAIIRKIRRHIAMIMAVDSGDVMNIMPLANITIASIRASGMQPSKTASHQHERRRIMARHRALRRSCVREAQPAFIAAWCRAKLFLYLWWPMDVKHHGHRHFTIWHKQPPSGVIITNKRLINRHAFAVGNF